MAYDPRSGWRSALYGDADNPSTKSWHYREPKSGQDARLTCPKCGVRFGLTNLAEAHIPYCGGPGVPIGQSDKGLPWAGGEPMPPPKFTRQGTWGPLALSLLVFAPVGFGMALWRLIKRYGGYREVIALVVSGIQILLAVVLLVTSLGGGMRGPQHAQLSRQLLSQVRSNGSNGFDTPKAASIKCEWDGWSVGKSFTCYVYDTTVNLVGRVVVTPTPTVTKDGQSYWEWQDNFYPAGL